MPNNQMSENPIVRKKEERGRRRKSRRKEIQQSHIAAEQYIIDNNRFIQKNLNSYIYLQSSE